MNDQEKHEELVRGVSAQQREILENSFQAIYIYLDDSHNVFNKRFASLLGYGSVKELEDFKGSFMSAFIAEKSQKDLVEAYKKAMDSLAASSVDIVLKKKSGGEVKTHFILAPLMYDGHTFAIHFIS